MSTMPKLEVPKDLRQMSFLLTQWGIWTRIGMGCQCSVLATLINSANKSTACSRDVFLSNDDECAAVDSLICTLKAESPMYYSWVAAHYSKGIPLKVLAKEAHISEHKVVQILVAAEERLLAIADRAKRLTECY